MSEKDKFDVTIRSHNEPVKKTQKYFEIPNPEDKVHDFLNGKSILETIKDIEPYNPVEETNGILNNVLKELREQKKVNKKQKIFNFISITANIILFIISISSFSTGTLVFKINRFMEIIKQLF